MRDRRKVSLIAGMILMVGIAHAAAAAPPDPMPWLHVIRGEGGQVLAATGRDATRTAVALTVATAKNGEATTATTTYVRGRAALKIDRTYDAAAGLTVIYATERERMSLEVRQDPATGDTMARYTMPEGSVYEARVDLAGNVSGCDLGELRIALQAEGGVRGLLRHYQKDVKVFEGSVPEAGSYFMWQIPSADCLDACGAGCAKQCAWECLIPGMIVCATCKVSCAAGCYIGCAL